MLSLISMASQPSSSRLVYGADDVLFGHIEEQQKELPWGNILDAGTGLHSLRWLATLDSAEGITAVTADRTMQRNCQDELEAILGTDNQAKDKFKVLIGNWFATQPLEFPAASFDVILCDYLIGAMDGFSPFHQDEMIPKLTRLLKPGTGRLYVIGLQPIPPNTNNLLSRVVRVRDACILLAGHLCYREYPLSWIQRHIDANSKLELLGTVQYPIRYSAATIIKQIQVARNKLRYFPSDSLRAAMTSQLDELTSEAHSAAPITQGFDYVVTAQRRSS